MPANTNTPFDPFGQFQTAAGTYKDPVTGQEVNGDAAGIPFYQSSRLTPEGYSSTGTTSNPFAGFVDSVGGAFGGTDATRAADAPMNAKLTTALAAPTDYSQVDPKELSRLGQQWQQFLTKGGSSTLDQRGGQNAVQSNLPNPVDEIRNKTIQGLPLTHTEQAFMAMQQGNGLATGQSGTTNADGSVNPEVDRGGQISPYRFDAQGNAVYDPALGRIAGVDATGKPLTGDYQAQLIQQGLMTPEQATKLNATRDATNAAANAPTAPVDADPFGRFDNPASPTHGVITPATEAALAAQSGTLTAPPANPILPPAQPSPTASAPVTAPAIPAPTPPITPANPATINPFTGFMPQGPTDTGPGGVTTPGIGLSPAPSPGPTDTGPGGLITPGLSFQPDGPLAPASPGFQATDYGQSAPTAPADGGGVTAPKLRPVISSGFQRAATGNYSGGGPPTAGMRPVRPAGQGASLGGGAPAAY